MKIARQGRPSPVLVTLLLALAGSADGDGQLYVKLERSADPAKVYHRP